MYNKYFSEVGTALKKTFPKFVQDSEYNKYYSKSINPYNSFSKKADNMKTIIADLNQDENPILTEHFQRIEKQIDKEMQSNDLLRGSFPPAAFSKEEIVILDNAGKEIDDWNKKLNNINE
jgi:hypothetical protein